MSTSAQFPEPQCSVYCSLDSICSFTVQNRSHFVEICGLYSMIALYISVNKYKFDIKYIANSNIKLSTPVAKH